MNDCMRGLRPRSEFRNRGEQQPAQRGIAERLLKESLEGYVDETVAAERVVAKILRCSDKRRRRISAFYIAEGRVHAFPVEHAPDHFGGGNESSCKLGAGVGGRQVLRKVTGVARIIGAVRRALAASRL